MLNKNIIRYLFAFSFFIGCAKGHDINSGNYLDRIIAIEEFEEGNIHSKNGLPSVIECLSDENPLVRSQAAKTIGSLSCNPGIVIPKLIIMLGDEDWRPRSNAAWAIMVYGSKGKIIDKHERMAIGPLTELLRDEKCYVRSESVRAIGKLGENARSSLDRIVELLHDDYSYARCNAVGAIGDIGTRDEEIITAIRKLLLEDEDLEVRTQCAITLGKIGKGNDKVRMALKRVMSGKEYNEGILRECAAKAYYGLSGKAR